MNFAFRKQISRLDFSNLLRCFFFLGFFIHYPLSTIHFSAHAELYQLPSEPPESYADIRQELRNIEEDLATAMCGGWMFTTPVNGVFDQEETVCPPAADVKIGGVCFDTTDTPWTKVAANTWEANGNTIPDSAMDSRGKRTERDKGLIAKVEGVPGRDTVRAYGNLYSGYGMREEQVGEQILVYDAQEKRRKEGLQTTGLSYPDTPEVCGLATVCRPPSHPDGRTPPPGTSQADRDRPGFFCDNACQRPLDSPGKPENHDPEDATAAECGSQQPYGEDGIQYACGGGETKGPGENFCAELQQNGQLGGVCQDMNSWVYILWKRLVHICLEPTVPTPAQPLPVIPVPIYEYKKGGCGFPGEIVNNNDSSAMRDDGWSPEGMFECCSDDPYATFGQYDPSHKGTSCIPCQGADCRLGQTDTVIVNDEWVAPYPQDLSGGCNVDLPTGVPINDVLAALGISLGENALPIGSWSPDEQRKQKTEEREYISYFREYANASYERAPLTATDDHKKENIPVACYGMYDTSPEDAKNVQIQPKDNRCVIAAYYDDVNFRNMKETQKGVGEYDPDVEDLPPEDAPGGGSYPLWFPVTAGAFSMLNDDVFKGNYNENFSFALLATDTARQRATVQLDARRPLSSGALLRVPDDTVTNVEDDRKDRRTFVEWWQMTQTEMQKTFTPPTVRLLLPTAWTTDLSALDPISVDRIVEETSPDIRSERIEVQVQASDDLLGTITAFLEDALLLRAEEAPIPIVAPLINPVEVRGWAQGWDTWATKQEEQELEGVAQARKVAEDLRAYADRADEVRAIRAALPRHASALLERHEIVREELAEWTEQNIEGYYAYLSHHWGIELMQARWQVVQAEYRKMHDEGAFPWCRNDRFTAPIYSLLDPWLPGREDGDKTAGLESYTSCLRELATAAPSNCPGIDDPLGCVFSQAPSCNGMQSDPIMADTIECHAYVARQYKELAPDRFTTFDVCERFLPLPPLMPQPPQTVRGADVVLDFTALRGLEQAVRLPVLKPVQIRIKFNEVRPPSLEQDDPPEEFPVLPPLPPLPDALIEDMMNSIPEVILPEDNGLQTLRNTPAFSQDDIPALEVLNLVEFLNETETLIQNMRKSYETFWGSLLLEPKAGTEQDCISPNNGTCVHFEFDVKERLQRIGARPGIFLQDDFRSKGDFRDPLTHGQSYCERADWACQLLNAVHIRQREGWMLDATDGYDTNAQMDALRKRARDGFDADFLYDIVPEQFFDIFSVPTSEQLR